MAYIYVLRQPLTGESKELQQSSIEFMERMRTYCKEKGHNIQKLFEDDDEEKVGSVPGKTLFLVQLIFFKLRFDTQNTCVIFSCTLQNLHLRTSLNKSSVDRLAFQWMKFGGLLISSEFRMAVFGTRGFTF